MSIRDENKTLHYTIGDVVAAPVEAKDKVDMGMQVVTILWATHGQPYEARIVTRAEDGTRHLLSPNQLGLIWV